MGELAATLSQIRMAKTRARMMYVLGAAFLLAAIWYLFELWRIPRLIKNKYHLQGSGTEIGQYLSSVRQQASQPIDDDPNAQMNSEGTIPVRDARPEDTLFDPTSMFSPHGEPEENGRDDDDKDSESGEPKKRFRAFRRVHHRSVNWKEAQQKAEEKILLANPDTASNEDELVNNGRMAPGDATRDEAAAGGGGVSEPGDPSAGEDEVEDGYEVDDPSLFASQSEDEVAAEPDAETIASEWKQKEIADDIGEGGADESNDDTDPDVADLMAVQREPRADNAVGVVEVPDVVGLDADELPADLVAIPDDADGLPDGTDELPVDADELPADADELLDDPDPS